MSVTGVCAYVYTNVHTCLYTRPMSTQISTPACAQTQQVMQAHVHSITNVHYACIEHRMHAYTRFYTSNSHVYTHANSHVHRYPLLSESDNSWGLTLWSWPLMPDIAAPDRPQTRCKGIYKVVQARTALTGLYVPFLGYI